MDARSVIIGIVGFAAAGEPTPLRVGSGTLEPAPLLPCRVARVDVSNGAGNCTFYVSSSAAGANDGNAGTDPDRPLATLPGVLKGIPGGLRPGDRVLLRRGDIWHLGPGGVRLPGCIAAAPAACPSGCVCHVQPTAATTAATTIGTTTDPSPAQIPVLFGAYGDPNYPRPSLVGTLAVGSAVVAGVNLEQVDFESIEFSGAEAGVSLVYTDVHGRYSGVSIRDCDFHDIQWANFTSNITVIYGGGNAVELRNPSADSCQTPGSPCPTPLLCDLEISNCIFERVDMGFSTRVARTGLPLGVRDGVSTHNARITGNFFRNCSFNTVMVDGATQFSLQHNVFLRGQPRTRFGYGTTDVIIAYADASSVVANNDFTLRGEHADDPDGCGIDLETNSKDLVLGPNNTFYKSVAASVNIFGHTFAGAPPQTSKNLTIVGNVMVEVGCAQGLPPYHVGSSDRGAIAFDLPNGTGSIAKNLIIKCSDPSVPLWGGPKGYTDGFSFAGNTIVTAAQVATVVVDMPAIESAAGKRWPGLAVTCDTNGADIRYTLDGSRPTEASPLWPPAPRATSPGRTAVLVRAFKAGLAPSATNGVVVGDV